MSIYGKLYAYRQREDRSELENFLSEALVDLLNRMPRDLVVGFVAEILLGGDDARAAWREYVEGIQNLLWSTQRHIRIGNQSHRLDILLESDGRKTLVIESKIGSAVRIYHEHNGGRETEALEASSADPSPAKVPNQLQKYGCWLASECRDDAWQGALVLLTHWSPAPDDFRKRDCKAYGVPWRHTCRWHEVWRWLRVLPAQNQEGADAGRDDPAWKALAKELADFLREKNMASATMTSFDVTAAEFYVGSAGRMAETFRRIGEGLSPVLRELAVRTSYGPEYDSEGRVFWAWAYLKSPYAPDGANWHVTWGIRFPTGSKWWNLVTPPLPQTTHAFVSFCGEGKPWPPLDSIAQPKYLLHEWAPTDDRELVIGRSLHEFPTDPEEMTGAIADWIHERLESLKPVLPPLKEAALVQTVGA